MSLLADYKHILIPSLLCLPSVYFWKKLYDVYALMRKEEDCHRLHNCVIMISREYIRGWPPAPVIQINTHNVHRFLEPFLYFMNTARFSLDVAVMSISIPQLQNALAAAMKRGVRVRVIVNFQSMSKVQHATFQRFMESGMQLAPHIEEVRELNHIMHLKCIVKDYDPSGGYLCIGSMNYSNLSTIVNNFEDIVLTSSFFIVKQFHENFERVWNIIKEKNKSEVNRKILVAAGYNV